MATRAHQPEPIDVLLAAIPGLPRALLDRLTARMIERLDEIDGNPDDEDDDPGGGNVEDEGEMATVEDAGGDYGEDQREMRWSGGSLRIG